MSVQPLPISPWDALIKLRQTAAEYPGGLIDLSIGAPIDPVPDAVTAALAAAADSPGYPAAVGSGRLRRAIMAWLDRQVGAGCHTEAVLPTLGSKEFIGWLPTLLGLGPTHVVAIPELAYPTYEVGARTAGASVLRYTPEDLLNGAADGRPPSLIWINSPSNPSGEVLPVATLVELIRWARTKGCLMASDECYFGLGWEQSPVSVLDPSVTGGDHTGVLAVHTLSKRSNMAGYRVGFVAGDPAVMSRLRGSRRQLGMIVPAPIQAAAAVALDDDTHAVLQRERYGRRRQLLRPALESAGFRIDHSQAGMYLWATRDEDGWDSVAWLAGRGILAAPGEFYGARGARHIRVGLTVSDDRVGEVARRLA
ncbi:MAG TPA: succinyldiaminopimelate transaminase [Mycobacteriales bacterium]|nr:succinyldiaminopimelate transaminase [Mycobacteriales bacterium]